VKKVYEASARIKATPERIWQILTDAPNIARWDSGVIRIDGTIAPGARIAVTSSVNPNRAFPIKVEELIPHRRMVWADGMPLGLFRGARTYTLTPEADGMTTFTMREEFTGLLSGLIVRSIPDMQPSFDKFARGLKAEAERASA
jgi:hypothetical protein